MPTTAAAARGGRATWWLALRLCDRCVAPFDVESVSMRRCEASGEPYSHPKKMLKVYFLFAPLGDP